MVNDSARIIFSNEAKKSLQAAYDYSKKDSVQNAEKVREKIIQSIKEIVKNPERYSPDKFKLDNDGSYRAFEIYRYRISFFISAAEIRIIRIRHTKMNPLVY